MAYEPRDYINETAYADISDTQPTTDVGQFTDPNEVVAGELAPVASYNGPSAADFAASAEAVMNGGLSHNNTSPTSADLVQAQMALTQPASITTTNQRGKSVTKPDRPVTKNDAGKFICTWPGCTDTTKEYSRRCEWRYVFPKTCFSFSFFSIY